MKLTKIDSISSLFFVSFSAFAIVKHKFLDIRLIILRTITYSLIVLLVSAAFVGVTILSIRVFQTRLGTPLDAPTILTAIGLAIVVVLVLDPLKRAIGLLTDRLFFKGRINYPVLLQRLSEIVNRELDLEKLLSTVGVELSQGLKIQSSHIYLAESRTGPLVPRSPGQQQKLERSDPIIRHVETEGRIVVLEALERKIEDTTAPTERQALEQSKVELDRLNAAVVAPVTVDNQLTAILVLGPKLSGDPFSDDDLNLLQLLGPQLASALEKARLYDETKQFSEKLKKEIAIATEDVRLSNLQLADRNRFLSALQKVTSLITRSLDFRKVTQDIVDSISKELGYLGGLLLFLGDSRRKVFPEAITHTPITEKVLKLLPKAMSEYHGNFEQDKTKSVIAIRTGKPQTGERLSEFISPPVPASVCDAVQEAAKIKAIIAVPIYSEAEVVGCIDFFLDRDAGSLTKIDLEMMQALANETGIIYRNITLVRKLEQSNRELEEANEHLKMLDQAKSEFVSIASHQLRTPMTGIMGYLSMLVAGDFGKIDPKQTVILQNILAESQRMIKMINIFLDVTKIESGKLHLDLEPTHIEEVIARQIETVAATAKEKGLTVTYRPPKPPLPATVVDRDKIGEVVLNLIDNAIKYTAEGGITVESRAEDGNIQVSVKDTGIGIEPKEAKELFAKFVRGFGIAQINPDGSGLGLYVARRIVEAHAGKIWVESKGKGKGSTFHFSIPIRMETRSVS